MKNGGYPDGRHHHPRSHSMSAGGSGVSGVSFAAVPSASIYSLHNHPNHATTMGGMDAQMMGMMMMQHSQSQLTGFNGENGGTYVVNSGNGRSGTKLKGPPERSGTARQPAAASGAWIERVFRKRECIKFIPAEADEEYQSDRCQCGRASAEHSQLALSRFTTAIVTRRAGCVNDVHASVTHPSASVRSQQHRWTIDTCTAASPTDAYGTIQFQGGPHVHKARYVRLSFDSDPADVMHLLERVWGLTRPRLVISIQGGGGADFKVPESLGKVFREGILRAAGSTGAWVLTSGLDAGVVQHVARALDEAGISARMRSRIVTVGIAPWGVLQRREQLVGRHKCVSYRDASAPYASRDAGASLNDRHAYFLLADNGTSGRAGADAVLRTRLETHLACSTSRRACRRRIPIVCVLIEGGDNAVCTLNTAHRYLTRPPCIPVIICECNGRISSLLEMAARHVDTGELTSDALLARLQQHEMALPDAVDAILDRIVQCARHNGALLTIFHPRAGQHQRQSAAHLDHAILRALLRQRTPNAVVDQLLLTLAWGRVDIARCEIFRQGPDQRPVDPALLVKPMMEALLRGRVDFVRLFLEQGLSLKRFLTFDRLEAMYNTEPSALNTLLLNGRTQSAGRTARNAAFTLPEIGVAIERLMGNAFRCSYTTRAFKVRYTRARSGGSLRSLRRGATRNFSSLNMCLGAMDGAEEEAATDIPRKCALASPYSAAQTHASPKADFAHPCNELLLWAVLTRRAEMARLFWHYGEEPLAKALCAIRLYKCMSREAAHDYTEVEVSNQLRECANEFRECSLELLHHCHQQDPQLTMRLLTAQLPNWGNHTCLSLAVIANNKRFLAHPCCQILLAELWHGGLRFRCQSNVKVVLGILFPPSILLLDFKTSIASNDASHQADDTDADAGSSASDGGDGTHAEQQQRKRSLRTLFGAARNGSGKRLLRPETDVVDGEEDADADEGVRCECVLQKRPKTQPGSAAGRPAACSRLQRALAKCVLFYRAPISSFWTWSLSFACFMLALIYVLLVELPIDRVPPVEWFLFIYVLALAMEHFRKLFVLESSSLVEKLGVFYARYWNMLTTVSVLSYFVGFAFRLNPATVHTLCRTILASNSVLWHMKLFDFLSVHPRIGPYITMAGKMVLAMSYIIILLMVTLMAFGVARQSITFPHEKWAWLLVRNIFYKPYFMLYGEVYAGEIDTCGDEGTNCVPGGWIPPVLMTMFLLVANILLINMLIGAMSNIFNVTNAMSQQVWMFQRYEQVLEYKSTPILPPPLTPLAHLWMLIRYLTKPKQPPACPLHNCQTTGAENGDFALKVQLSAEELQDLQDFEEDCMDDLSRRKYRNNAPESECTESESVAEDDAPACKHCGCACMRQLHARLDALQQALLAEPETRIAASTSACSSKPRACIPPLHSAGAPAKIRQARLHSSDDEIEQMLGLCSVPQR